jgi:proteic killer suppression protein
MIKSFSSKRVKDIYNGINSRYSRSLPKELHNKAYRLLDQLNAITLVELYLNGIMVMQKK